MKLAYLALIIISKVACIDESWDEADEIYRSVNEEMSEKDQEILMDLFSKKDQGDPYLYNPVKKNEHGLEMESNVNHLEQIAKLEAEIDLIDKKLDVSFPKSGGYKRKSDNLEVNNYQHPTHESQYLDKSSKNEHIGISSHHDTGINAPPRKRQKTTEGIVSAAHSRKISPLDSSVQTKDLDNGSRSSQIFNAKKIVSDYQFLDKKLDVSFPKSGGYKRKSDNLEVNNYQHPTHESQYLDKSSKNDHIGISSHHDTGINAPPRKRQKTTEGIVSAAHSMKISPIDSSAQTKDLDNGSRSSQIFNAKKIVSDYFGNYLVHLHLPSGTDPWSYLKKEDFINWPKNLPIKSPEKYTPIELKVFLLTLEQIRFSDRYISKILKARKRSL